MLQPPLASRTARKVEPSSETQPSAPGAPWPSLRDGQPGLDPRTAENARRHSLESPGTSPVLGTGLWSRPHHGADIQVARRTICDSPSVSAIRPPKLTYAATPIAIPAGRAPLVPTRPPAPLRRRSQSLMYKPSHAGEVVPPLPIHRSILPSSEPRPAPVSLRLRSPPLPPLPAKDAFSTASSFPEACAPPVPPKTWSANAHATRTRPTLTRTPSARTPSLSRAASSSSSRTSSSAWTPARLRSSMYSTGSEAGDQEELCARNDHNMGYSSQPAWSNREKSSPARLDISLAGLGIQDSSEDASGLLTGRPYCDDDDFETSLEYLARFARSLPSPVTGLGVEAETEHLGYVGDALSAADPASEPTRLSSASTEPQSSDRPQPRTHMAQRSHPDNDPMYSITTHQETVLEPEHPCFAAVGRVTLATDDGKSEPERDPQVLTQHEQVFSPDLDQDYSFASQGSEIELVGALRRSDAEATIRLVDLTGKSVEEEIIPSDTTHLILTRCHAVPGLLGHLAGKGLVVLDISHCALDTIPATLTSLQHLQELDVSGNHLSDRVLPDVIFTLRSLRALAANECGLVRLDDKIAHLTQLHTLSLQKNQLSQLPVSLCRLTALQTLYLDGNVFRGEMRSIVQGAVLAYRWGRLCVHSDLQGADLGTDSRSNSVVSPGARSSALETQETPFDNSTSNWSTRIIKRMRSGTNLASSRDGSPSSKLKKARPKRRVNRQSFLRIEGAVADPVDSTQDSRTTLHAILSYLRDLDDLGANDNVLGSTHELSGTEPAVKTANPQESLPASHSLPALPQSSSTPFRGMTGSCHASDNHSDSNGSLNESPFIKLRDDAAKRDCVVREIVETERTYVRGLEELCQIYIHEDGPLPDGETRVVFGNVEAILDFHRRTILPELIKASGLTDKPVLPSGDSCKVACDVAKVFVRHAAWLGIYSSYVNGYDSALARIQSASKHKRVRSWLKHCKRHANHSQIDLESYLLLPVQRVPRYRMLLESLTASTPNPRASMPLSQLESVELDPLAPHPILQEALALVSRVATGMNERKRDVEGRARLLHWQDRIGDRLPSPLVQPHRVVLREGHVHVIQTVTGEGVQVDARKLVALLCTDLFLLMEERSRDLYMIVRLKTPIQATSLGEVLRVLIDRRLVLYIHCKDAASWTRTLNTQIALNTGK